MVSRLVAARLIRRCSPTILYTRQNLDRKWGLRRCHAYRCIESCRTWRPRDSFTSHSFLLHLFCACGAANAPARMQRALVSVVGNGHVMRSFAISHYYTNSSFWFTYKARKVRNYFLKNCPLKTVLMNWYIFLVIILNLFSSILHNQLSSIYSLLKMLTNGWRIVGHFWN